MNRKSHDGFSPVKSVADRLTSRSPHANYDDERANDSLIRPKICPRSPLLRNRFRGRRIASTSLSPTQRMGSSRSSREPENDNSSYYLNIRKRSPLLRSRSRKRRNSVMLMSLSPTAKRRRTRSPSRGVPDTNSFHLKIRGRSPLLHNRYSGRRILAKDWSLSPAKRVLTIQSNGTNNSYDYTPENGYFHLNIRKRSPILRKRQLFTTTTQKDGSTSFVNIRLPLKFRERTQNQGRDEPTTS